MPIIKRAIKKLRRDRKVTVTNAAKRAALRSVIKTFRKTPSVKTLAGAFKALDKAAKTNVIHKKKAARLKSRIAKLVAAK